MYFLVGTVQASGAQPGDVIILIIIFAVGGYVVRNIMSFQISQRCD